ncbi:endonuclease/exonuclease/phosphatase family protein [Actinomadura sp. HBU206391]|uniref:endonuclease/exonuclease/phosphatase family protein n=1 Tax=Actinomadura sp. HBU206391 TaxID=2731692 RepID=UPI00164F2647|nr:endonuclease/exonuclease/phosphatase family protein [Actinomadura sp. HBU206391]MBC6462956.1 endonuclease/exonuclease/phosphatase family protein [Actinomadura sp. HBU206391]
MPTVRVLSYNIRSLRDDTAALERVVRGCAPDLVCLQEVPRFLLWRTKRRRFARRCELTVAAGRRAAGLAVLAGPRATVLHREYHLLTRVTGLHRRGLAIAVAEVQGVRLIAASTHLDLADVPRRAHVGQLLGLLERARRTYRAPVVLTGDINEESGGQAWDLLAGSFQDAYAVAPAGMGHTFSARRPRRRIDGIFADPDVEVVGCGVPADTAVSADYTRATDHRPVFAELCLRR